MQTFLVSAGPFSQIREQGELCCDHLQSLGCLIHLKLQVLEAHVPEFKSSRCTHMLMQLEKSRMEQRL